MRGLSPILRVLLYMKLTCYTNAQSCSIVSLMHLSTVSMQSQERMPQKTT